MIRFKSDKSGLSQYLKTHPHIEGIIVGVEDRFIYMKPTKTAGTAILKELRSKSIEFFYKEQNPARFQNWIENISDTELEDYFIFTVVRNPFDRFISSARYLKIPIDNLLNNFVDLTTNRIIFDHTLPLHYYTHNKKKLFVDYMCRFESIDADLNIVCDNIGLDRLDLSVINRSKRKKYQHYYDKNRIERVKELYKTDIDLYGYKYEEGRKRRDTHTSFYFEKIKKKIGINF